MKRIELRLLGSILFYASIAFIPEALMKADISKTGEENVFLLIKNTPGNENTPVTQENSSLGVVDVIPTVDGYNTSLRISAIDGQGITGSALLTYKRPALNTLVAEPPLQFSLDPNETAESLLARVAVAFGVREDNIEFTTDLPEFESTATIIVQAKTTSYLYQGQQQLTLTKDTVIPQSWTRISNQFTTLGNTGGWNYH